MGGVSNIYNQAKANAINALKQNAAGQAKKASTAKNVDMTKAGSIFNLVGGNKPTATGAPSLVDSNITRSLTDINRKPVNPAQGKGSSNNDYGNIDSVSEGKAAAAKVEGQTDSIEGKTAQTQAAARATQSLGDDAQKLNGLTVKTDKTFKSQHAKLAAELKKDNDKLDKTVKENEEIEKEVDNAQRELDSLLSNSSSLRGTQGSGSNSNASKITELQSFIGAKVGVMQANGRVIYSLQRSQSRTISSMNRTNRQYIRTQNANTKALKHNQDETNSTIKTATEIEKYSMIVQMGGQTLALAGKGLMALGGLFGATGGAALVAIGQVMEKVGTVAELAGKYGATAANITKTVGYMAEGNIQGAMMSCAAAIQSGTAAAKSTMSIKSDFAKIDASATETTNKITAREAGGNIVTKQQNDQLTELLAKQNGIDTKDMTTENITNALKERKIDVTNMSQKDLKKALENAGVQKDQINKAMLINGMTGKQARQATEANLRNILNNNQINGVTSNHNQVGRLKQIRKEFEDGNISYKDSNNDPKNVNIKDILTTSGNNYRTALGKALPTGYTVDADGTIKDKNGNEVNLTQKENKNIKKVQKQVGKQAKTSFGAISNGSKSSTDWAKIGEGFNQTFTSMASMYMMFNGGMGNGMMMPGMMMGGMGNMMGMGSGMMGMGGMNYNTSNTHNSSRHHSSSHQTYRTRRYAGV